MLKVLVETLCVFTDEDSQQHACYFHDHQNRCTKYNDISTMFDILEGKSPLVFVKIY